MELLYTALENLARCESNKDPALARLTIETIEENYQMGRIDLVEKSQLLDILSN